MTFVPDEGRIPKVHHPSAIGPDGRTRRMVTCDNCQVRTYCRLSDGLYLCADRCWPYEAEEYNSRRGDEVRCIHCDRRIMFSRQDNAWVHWQINRLECEATTYAQPPTNYRP